MMKLTYKKIGLFSILALSCLSFQTIMTNDSQLSATFKIVADLNTKYIAEITVTNNGPKITGGWQLDFDFSSKDQTIKKIWSNKAIIKDGHVTIINSPQHIRIPANSSRNIRLEINKKANTTPSIPNIIATVLNN